MLLMTSEVHSVRKIISEKFEESKICWSYFHVFSRWSKSRHHFPNKKHDSIKRFCIEWQIIEKSYVLHAALVMRPSQMSLCVIFFVFWPCGFVVFWPFSETLDENWLSWKSLSSGPEALHANSLCKIITKDSIGVLISWIVMVGVTKT